MKTTTLTLTYEELEVLILGSRTFREKVINSLFTTTTTTTTTNEEANEEIIKEWIRKNYPKSDKDYGKLDAIKAVRRNFTGFGLKECKYLIERVWGEKG
jgi:ribosomal protein L7/L12